MMHATPSATNAFSHGAMREVSFDSQSHFSVLFQMYGSVWPKVLPYCVANVALTGLILYLANVRGVDLTFSDKGHTFMSLMVSFLVVSRAQIVYARYMEARAHLSTAMRACRELVHHAAVLTLYERGREARKWRYEVSFKTILLLRVLCAAIEHQSCGKNAWEIPEMDEEDHRVLRKSLILDYHEEGDEHGDGGAYYNGDKGSDSNQAGEPLLHGGRRSPPPPPPPPIFAASPGGVNVNRLAHGRRTQSDENFRVPVLLSYQLREAIVSQRNGRLSTELHVNEELKILSFVTEFNVAFHGLRKLITTPFPFPLVQMARTFLFFWVFTLPFSLVGDIDQPVQIMMIMFVLTYGFVGLEYVSMELDDPFGDDPNDFDDLTMAQMVFEDIYITINEIDGRDAADELRRKVRNRSSVGTEFESFSGGEGLFGSSGGGGGGHGHASSMGGGGGSGAVGETVFEGSPLIPKGDFREYHAGEERASSLRSIVSGGDGARAGGGGAGVGNGNGNNHYQTTL